MAAWNSQLHMQPFSPHFSIFRALLMALHTIHPAQPWCTSYLPSTYFCHQHHSGHTVLIHFFHMPKPSQHFLIRSTRLLPFYSSSPTHIFIHNSSIRDTPTKLSNILSQEYSLSFSQHSHTPCLCTVHCHWYPRYLKGTWYPRYLKITWYPRYLKVHLKKAHKRSIPFL